jgi:O-antigen ligase
MKKANVVSWVSAACILLQTESMLPSSIVLMAILSFSLAPSLYVNRYKLIFITEHYKWILISILIATTTALTGFNSVSVSYLINYISMFFLITYVSIKFSVKDIANVLYFISLVSLCAVIWKFFIVDNADVNLLSEMRFVFSDRNDLGLYLVAGFFANMNTIMSRAGREVTFRKAILATTFIVLIVLGSRSAILALSLGIISYMFFLRAMRKLLFLSAIIFLVVFVLFFLLPSNLILNLRLFNPESSIGDSDIIRLSLMFAAFELFLQSPLFGIGPNLFMVKSGDYLSDLAPNLMSGLNLSNGLVTHNSYIQYFVELGIIVGVFVIYRLFKTFRLFFIVVSIQMSADRRNDLAFLFAVSSAFAVSGFFLNLHSAILFIFVIFSMDVFALRIMRSNE